MIDFGFEGNERRNDPFRNQSSLGIIYRISDSKSVKLYLISPYKRDTAVIRPYLWTGNPGLFSDITNLMNERRGEYLSTMGGSVKKGFFLDRTRASHQAMMPSEVFHEYQSPVLDKHGWYFILVVNNEPTIGRRYFNEGGKKNRTITTGFCIGDEPVIHRNGRDVINENAPFFITHQTTIEVDDNRVDRNGSHSVALVSKDVDIFSRSMLEINHVKGSDSRDYILDPGEVMSSSMFVADQSGENIYAADSSALASLSSMGNKVFKEDSIMNSPKHHVNRVMNCLFQTVTEAENKRTLGAGIGGNIDGIYDSYLDSQRFRSYLKGGHPDVVKGLNVEEPYIEFRDIINRYPDVTKNIEIFSLENGVDESTYGLSEIEKAPNVHSTLSALIKSSVPPIMQDCGLSDFSFRWASSVPNEFNTFKLNREPVLKVYSVGTIVPEVESISSARVKDAMRQLERYVFTTVEDVAGEFEVYINYSSGRRTVVHLQLRELTDRVNDNYVVGQNDLGGIISPMIGTDNDYNSHVKTLQSMLAITSDNFKDSSESFNIASENTDIFGGYNETFDNNDRRF